ncbi:PREDICTED: zinc finger protein 267 isoform X1 [Rhagoletis zephyria]|uniref:zinc finger protein 267 isoform X1 n=1 Tax=Rhagoletis zephyria TaxID=28612 RepID=UPI000811A65E|nr:PREDICTED: zinc finger protein 267 isoform X1 [Rhagoletis zephyria]
MSLAMANICRACLLKKQFKELYDWYMPMDDINEPLTLMECFQLCTQLDVNKTSPKSQMKMHYLCKDCVHELINAFRFIRKAQKSDQELCRHGTGCKNQSERFEWINMQEYDDSSRCESEQVSYEEHLAIEYLIEEQREAHDLDTLNSSPENRQSTNNNNNSENYLLTEMEETELWHLKNSKKNECLEERLKYKPNSIDDPEKELSRMAPEIGKQSATNACGASSMIICEYCSKPLKGNQYKRHISRFHSKNEQIMLCYACPSTFEDAVGLKRHEETHQANRKRSISCNEYQRKFFTQNAYKTHIKTHEENREPQFKCDQCEKSFFYKGGLKLHKQCHTGLSLKCKVCSKQYPRPVDLEIHLRSHSGELPYKCPKCNKCFKYVHVLNKHVRHHEGHRYKCNLCGKEYAHQSTMLQHRKEHTGLPLRCSICDKGFVKKSKMRRHIGGVHKVTDVEEIDQLIVKVKTKSIYRGRVTEI